MTVDKIKKAAYSTARNAERKSAGLCANCPQPALPGKTLCVDCAMARKTRQTERKAAGGCRSCHQPAEEGKTLCADCSARAAARQAERYAERKTVKICLHCPQPAEEGKVRCKEHVEYMAERYIARTAERKSAGVCKNCLRPSLDGHALCEEHYLRATTRNHFGSPKRWEELRDLFYAQNGRCPYTGVLIVLGINASLDHIRPKSRGGSDELDNLCWTTDFLNILKHDHTIEELDVLLVQHGFGKLGTPRPRSQS